MLDERKFMILRAIIDDYILTAMPVGSRTISRKQGVGFSPATIRNEMSDLEELGYLAQPHTSAGRVPSDKAYRLYVDSLLKGGELSEQEKLRINDYISRRAGQVEDVIRAAADILADETQYTSVIVAPRIQTLRIRRVQLVPVDEGTALMIVVTGAGIIKDALISVPSDMSAENLYRLSEMLTNELSGHSLSEVRQIFAGVFRNLSINRRLLGGVLKVMEEKLTEDAPEDVVVGGTTKLLNYPEYSDIEKAKNFLSVFESKDRLAGLLKKSGGMEISIRIGTENELEQLKDCSLVTATYRVGQHGRGTLGIIGPTRMDYHRVVTIMQYMGGVISNMLSGEKNEV
ncbi:MAG: heat-inducible transcription repressor HrcA [Clostridia bacterium]|nr:heat-inducible transcription repressor HrcA [Clostridia bacterium]MBR6499737.1 heat-inducible transcription repressor HrcA [Clostridia bacterium]